MLHEKIEINVDGSTGGSTLTTYLIEPTEDLYHRERPLILLCPGGGYEFIAEREGEMLALQFLSMGYHAAVLRYSVAPAIFPTALTELATAVKIIREHAKEWHIIPNQIIVEGCSAGGHLAASLGTLWNDQEFDIASRVGTQPEMIQPNGLILCYPVITSGEYAHRGSFENLLRGIETEKLLEKVSLEKQVSKETPPTFIWHTDQDGLVPAENSILFVSALRKSGVSAEFHMYSVGDHGLAAASDVTLSPNKTENQPACQNWLSMADHWIKRLK